MFSFFYLKRHIFRDFGIAILMGVMLALSVVSYLLSNSIQSEREKLSILETEFPIWMEVSDIKGMQKDNLSITNSYIWALTREGEGYEIGSLITDHCFKRTLKIMVDQSKMSLCGITRREADTRLAPENGVSIRFYDGYSWESFQTDADYCLIPENMATEDVETFLMNIPEESIKITPIGVIYGGPEDVIYCSWDYINLLYKQYFDSDIESEVFRARVKDNSKLNELKAAMKRLFTHVDIMNTNSEYYFALTIFDSAYIQTHRSISEHLDLLRASRFIGSVLVVIIGFFSGFIVLRYRRRECFLLRIMGLRNGVILRMISLEYGLVCCMVFLCFAGASILIPSLQKSILYIVLIEICFITGVLIAVVHVLISVGRKLNV